MCVSVFLGRVVICRQGSWTAFSALILIQGNAITIDSDCNITILQLLVCCNTWWFYSSNQMDTSSLFWHGLSYTICTSFESTKQTFNIYFFKSEQISNNVFNRIIKNDCMHSQQLCCKHHHLQWMNSKGCRSTWLCNHRQ